jgi:hypothetical protein
LVGPEGSKNHQKGDSVPSYLTIAFQAHPSMRICSVREPTKMFHSYNGFSL